MELVSKEFVREAHAAACVEWKEKIEAQFPTLFPKVFDNLKKLPEYQEFITYLADKNDAVIISENGKIIKIKLPSANTEWTFKAWKLAIAICERVRYYPQHGAESDKTHITLKLKA